MRPQPDGVQNEDNRRVDLILRSPMSLSATAIPLDAIRYNEQGLVPAIVQDYLDGTVLMMA